jgi:hypothetical protein
LPWESLSGRVFVIQLGFFNPSNERLFANFALRGYTEIAPILSPELDKLILSIVIFHGGSCPKV